MTYIGEVHDWDNDPVAQDEAYTDVYDSPPWDDQRGTYPGDLRPIEGEDTHTETSVDTEEIIEGWVIWSDPADPGEVRQTSKEVA